MGVGFGRSPRRGPRHRLRHQFWRHPIGPLTTAHGCGFPYEACSRCERDAPDALGDDVFESLNYADGVTFANVDALFEHLNSLDEADPPAPGPPLYSGPHGDYTVHSIDECDACNPDA